MVDAISVFHREQKSIANELITFAAVCHLFPSLRRHHWHNISRCDRIVGDQYPLFFQHHFHRLRVKPVPSTRDGVPRDRHAGCRRLY